ncbi:hypothetical protein SAMN05216570_1608 [Dyella sp. OK004]|uniref:hypothetical protein n=1 Tax=Dyella sp. OK004 TaxID=1855292 RepID=UPI0008EB34D6|nr:hypothetical protein [Dyella sp. OK004]SFS02257.1 hypothetical protein SAMN05216570_1608 [Dyella sp. OK004]
MRRSLALPVALFALAGALAGCESRQPSTHAAPAAPPPDFAGEYIHNAKHLHITRRDDGYWLHIESTGSCEFEGPAILIGEQLQVSLQDWKAGALLTVRHAVQGGVDVLSEQEDDRFSLTYFCHDGETLSGSYRRQATAKNR